MNSQRWCLWLSCCLVLYSGLGPLAQSLLAPNSHSYTSSCFKYSPNKHNKHIFSHLEPAYFTQPVNLAWSLLTIDKTNPVATKDPTLLLPLELFDPETPHVAAEWHHLDMQTPSLVSPSPLGCLLSCSPLDGRLVSLTLEGLLLGYFPLIQLCPSTTH